VFINIHIYGVSVARLHEQVYALVMGTAALLEAVEALEFSPFEHAIIEKLTAVDRILASAFADLDRFDRDGMWDVCGATSLHKWLEVSCRRSGREAAAIVRQMRLLRSLPVTAEAFRDGTLAKGHIDVIGANVTAKTIREFADAESELIPKLAPLSIADTTHVMKVWAGRAKAATETGDSAPRRDIETDQLHTSELLNDVWKIDGTLTGPNAAIFNAALSRCMLEPVEGEPVRTFSQRQADALVEMARRVLQITDTTARRSSDALVLIPAETYVNGGVAFFADGTIVPPNVVKQFLCDSTITPLIQGPEGQPLWMGRAVRTVTDAQRRALVARDRHCAFPGCHRKAAWTEAHHLQEFQHGGLTDIDNLVLLCSRHHHLLHLSGWTAKLDDQQTLVVTTPSGRTLRAPPRSQLYD
jgi:hypothetical protein